MRARSGGENISYPSEFRMRLETGVANGMGVLINRVSKQKTKKRLLARTPPSLRDYLGCRFRLHATNNYTETHLWKRGRAPEHKAMVFLRKRLRGNSTVVVDVGANAGVFSLPILEACAPDSKLLAFEPNPVMFRRLAINVSLNTFEHVHLFDCAVGDAPGEAPMYFPRNVNFGQGRVGVAYKNSPENKGVVVQVRPLIDCLKAADIDRVDLLKVDVEGLEDRVIAPVLQGPEKYRPKAIYFEDAHDQHWKYPLSELLAKTGYGTPKRFLHNVFYVLGEDA